MFDWESAEEHEEEVAEYLKLDVLSLAELYKIYGGIMWSIFGIDIYHSISPSQYAMNCWLKLCPTDPVTQRALYEDIYIPHCGKEEDDFRSAYYGGRVTAQRRQYQSAQYNQQNEECELDENSVTEYLINADVNSLYPAVQHSEQYAYGKWEYADCTDFDLSRINLLSDPSLLARSQFKVDVHCPKDLLTPFLVHRDLKSKKLVHNLVDKEGCWYWGCELEEAIILGYRVTKVHECITFEHSGDLFTPYVNKCWQGRLDNPKKGPNANPTKNMAFKLAMNRLTGKFAQATHTTNTVIFSTKYKQDDKTENSFKVALHQLNDFTPIFCEGGNVAVMMDLDIADKNPDYPIYLSGQILAKSRVKMSQIMRIGNCYLEPKNAIYYTDTDSLVVPERVYPLWRKAGLLGAKLGQMSCDLHEWEGDEEIKEAAFSKIVKGIWAAPKGPYSLVYLDPGKNRLKEKIRTKGIPHPSGPFLYKERNEVTLDSAQYKELAHVLSWLHEPNLHTIPRNFIGKRFFVFTEQGKDEVSYAKHLTHGLIEKMMARTGTLACVFGGMKKVFLSDRGDVLEVRPDVVRRIACKTDWWSTRAPRFFKEEERNDVFALSYPTGYVQGRSTIDYVSESLLRDAQNNE